MKGVAATLAEYAARYETAKFLEGDPSWFMHQVDGRENQEATAFVASALSFGSRRQFMPKVQHLLDCAEGDMDRWVRGALYESRFARGDGECFYRFFTRGDMWSFFNAYRQLLAEFGTLGGYVGAQAHGDGFEAVKAICAWFANHEGGPAVPKNAQSACKRVCMFMRWMVRGGSPVDLGLWADRIDRRTLVMPLDTHVVQQAVRLGLLPGPCASMSAARRLTAAIAQVFPKDPLRGDFALFGYGVNNGEV